MAPQDKQPPIQGLLARAHSPDSAARIFNDKIQHRPVHLRPSSPSSGSHAADARTTRRRAREKKQQQRQKALKPKPVSARRRRVLGLYDVPQAAQKYAVFEPLHRLWLGYVREVLGPELYLGGQGAAAKLSSADFHGADVEVVRSSCPSRVGIRGIVVKDAQFVFELVTRANVVKVVPKEGTVFRLEMPTVDIDKKTRAQAARSKTRDDPDGEPVQETAEKSTFVFEVHGNQFMHRAADRATKKVKPRFLVDL
jgi:ribonuclease P protein subunit POP4